MDANINLRMVVHAIHPMMGSHHNNNGFIQSMRLLAWKVDTPSTDAFARIDLLCNTGLIEVQPVAQSAGLVWCPPTHRCSSLIGYPRVQ